MTEQVRLRVDVELVAEARKVFQSIGLSPSAAVSVFFAQCVKAGGLPFRPGEEPAKRPAKPLAMTPGERVELNELRIAKESRGKLGRLNSERLAELEKLEDSSGEGAPGVEVKGAEAAGS